MIERKLAEGSYRMTSLLSEVDCTYFQAERYFPDGIPANLNTRKEYLAFLRGEEGGAANGGPGVYGPRRAEENYYTILRDCFRM